MRLCNTLISHKKKKITFKREKKGEAKNYSKRNFKYNKDIIEFLDEKGKRFHTCIF